MRGWGFRTRQRRVGFPQCFLPVPIDPVGPEPPRKRRRTRAPPLAEEQEIFPQVEDADLQMNVDIGNSWLQPMETSV